MSFVNACSFSFDGKNSQDFDVAMARIGSADPDAATNGLTRQLKKTIGREGVRAYVYGAENTDVITFTFTIVKINGGEITRPQSMRINRWLMPSSLPRLLRFHDFDSCPLHYYAVCTQLKDILIGGRLVGKELTFETDSPYAFSDKGEKTYQVKASRIIRLHNSSDTDNGIYYPVITVSTQADTVVIENTTEQKSVTLHTTAVPTDEAGNKVIRLHSGNMTASDGYGRLIPAYKLGWDEAYRSYVSSADAYTDSIYWVRLVRGVNELKITGDCTFRIEYEYPRKAGCL